MTFMFFAPTPFDNSINNIQATKRIGIHTMPVPYELCDVHAYAHHPATLMISSPSLVFALSLAHCQCFGLSDLDVAYLAPTTPSSVMLLVSKFRAATGTACLQRNGCTCVRVYGWYGDRTLIVRPLVPTKQEKLFSMKRSWRR